MTCSVDTNILVYIPDVADSVKTQIANELITKAVKNQWPICAQVYGEFYNAAIRKQHATREKAQLQIQTWQLLMPAIVGSAEAHAEALILATKHQMQYWDAYIIASCAEHGVSTLYTEDVPTVKRPLGVRCVNPFA